MDRTLPDTLGGETAAGRWGADVLSRCEHLQSCALWRILDVTRQMGAPIDLQTILQQVIDAALEVLDAERGTVFLYDSDSNELYSQVATGEGEIRFPADTGIAGEAAKTRELVNVPDCYADPRFNRQIDKQTGFRTRCLLTIPLIGHDQSLVGVLQVLNKRNGVFDEDDEHLATALAAQCAVALQRAVLIAEHLIKEKLERDLALAREIQLRVLPAELPVVEGYDIAGWSVPADQTGGDIYDVTDLPDGRVALLLGDATGHGIGPALSVTQMRAMFRMALRLEANLDQLFAQINHQLHMDLPGNRFVTAFLGLLDPRRHCIEYHSGGQGPLLHFHAADRQTQRLDASTLPLGVLADPPINRPRAFEFAPGDIVALISDGVFEYANPEGRQFGLEPVAELFAEHAEESADQLIQRIRDAVHRFACGAEQGDDMTMVLIKRLPE